ncbi:ABC transporter substrate-binding protein [Mesorhizobium sp. BR1-1-16]|uniref:ABC transporter substrate-binding protein n=1 Tax=Mesorhizobium sp. BR1-1-16 TaxID=2876653 RepID=UPI001CCD51AC|nr:ABC transporter substrate-binding protein [Mesorhizobium sp. BR1-1-16]MBZ9938855.1 ABC transporter substrate-binding protein [Mesorhizobium sp. BR1-1-16]
MMDARRVSRLLSVGMAAALASSALMPIAQAMAQDAGTLVVDTAFQLKTADPAREFEPTANLILHPVYETLVTFKGSDLTKVEPSLSEAPVVSADAKTFTFQLNPAAKFSDGSPVTVDDVIFSLNRVKNVKGSPSFLLDGVTVSKGSKEGEVVLTTEQPDPGLPYKLANPAVGIVNAKVVTANQGSAAADADKTDRADAFFATTSVGSGPYVLEKFDMAAEVVLKRNDAYWGEKPKYEQIVIRNVETSAQQMNVMRDDSQIALDLRPDQLDAIKDAAYTISVPSADVVFMFTNSNADISPVAANSDFQTAVRLAIDYDGIVNIAGEGAVRPGSIIPTMFAGSLPTSEGPTRDVEAAKAALAKSGIKDPTIELTYVSDITKNGVSFADVAAKMQSDLKDVGITATLKPSPVSTFLDDYRAGTLPFTIVWWGPDFPDPSDYLLFGPGEKVGLRAGWKAGSSPAITEIAKKAAVEIDQTTRTKLYDEWQKKLNAEGPFTGLFQPAFSMASSKTLEPVEYNAMWTIDLTAISPAKQ